MFEDDIDENQPEITQPAPDQLALRFPIESINRIDLLMPNMLNDILKETCFAYSLWSTEGSEAVAASLLVAQGLPQNAGMPAFIDGQWTQWGWVDQHDQVQLPESSQDDIEPWDI